MSYVQDTLRAGHYENRMESVDLMVRTSPEIIADLVRLGVEFERDGEDFAFTRKGPTPNHVSSSFTRISPDRRSPASCSAQSENSPTWRFDPTPR